MPPPHGGRQLVDGLFGIFECMSFVEGDINGPMGAGIRVRVVLDAPPLNSMELSTEVRLYMPSIYLLIPYFHSTYILRISSSAFLYLLLIL